jgi:ring-1,2-phenylacetyl-CoA epoxidase subunit PaaC
LIIRLLDVKYIDFKTFIKTLKLENNLFNYTLRIADNALILGHRLSEWCGHGPILEQDMAMTNIALDLIGQARSLYQYAAEVQNLTSGRFETSPTFSAKTEDDIAYLRDVYDFKNVLLVEQPNGDFAQTIVRQFFFSAFQLPFYQKLTFSEDEILRGVSEKAVKEVAYHLRWSSEWVIRLGDGTAESHSRVQAAVEKLWTYSGENLIGDDLDNWAFSEGVGVDLKSIKNTFDETINAVLTEATLTKPTANFMQKGGKQGRHTEYLGFILAEMQFMQRAYPNMAW